VGWDGMESAGLAWGGVGLGRVICFVVVVVMVAVIGGSEVRGVGARAPGSELARRRAMGGRAREEAHAHAVSGLRAGRSAPGCWGRAVGSNGGCTVQDGGGTLGRPRGREARPPHAPKAMVATMTPTRPACHAFCTSVRCLWVMPVIERGRGRRGKTAAGRARFRFHGLPGRRRGSELQLLGLEA
jgi:hypothetical protein